ncbi:MAG: hypothetical protein LV481_09900 [Methylacidiphilales bacterium]|nr:hypothetical protein [Candidatus Methylacidiphilales bacterium]
MNLQTQRLQLYKIGRDYCDSHFDAKVGLILRDMRHQQPHMVSQSVAYASGLLMTKDPADRAKAESILRLVLTKQDLRKDSPTYGSFLPNYEDDWATVVNPDPNFGQFVGVGLAGVLDQDNKQGHLLSPDLRKQIEEAFRHTVDFTIRRDVAPDYINISIMSAAVGAAGDKLLNYPGARDFAMSKLEWILARAQPGFTFTEYLAPTYYGTDLGAAYAVKQSAASPDIASAANRLIDAFWKDIAGSYHAPTMQLGGPNSRSYGENMLEYAAGLKYFLVFALNGKYPLSDVETAQSWDCAGLMGMANAQIEPRPEFQEPTVPWREIAVMNRPGMTARQYREGDLIVGSISTQSVWQQQRNVVAYWPVTKATPDKPIPVVGFCMDESSMTLPNGYAHFFSTQSKGAVLVALTGKMPNPSTGGLQLVFNGEAEGAEMAGGPPGSCEVHDGDYTVDVYPVTQGAGAMAFRKDDTKNRGYVERMWDSADHVGNLGVLSYLVVFRIPGENAPDVKNIAFTPGDKTLNLTAEVNGTPLSLDVAF